MSRGGRFGCLPLLLPHHVGMTDVRRSFLRVQRPHVELRGDVLTTGRVRLTLQQDHQAHIWEEDTLEETMLLAATLPQLDAELYDAFTSELDLLGLRGDG